MFRIWSEFDPDYWETVSDWARGWLIEQIQEIIHVVERTWGTTNLPRQARRIIREMRLMTDALSAGDIIRAPPDTGGGDGGSQPGGDPPGNGGAEPDTGDGGAQPDNGARPASFGVIEVS